MSKKTKVILSNVQPNPKEAEIWAKINENGSREVKLYNSSTGKFECCGGSGSGSGDNIKYFMLVNYNYAELFQFEEGMTFNDWCNSKYNQFGFVYGEGGKLNMENVHNSIFTTTIIGQSQGELYGSIYDENSQDTLDLEVDDTTPITANASYYFSSPK